jgi:tetratricopeptide (TPR) repeat protein
VFCLLNCRSTVAQPPQSNQVRSLFEQAQSDLKANRPEDATREFQAILKLEPNNAGVRANLGLIAFTQANYQEAADNFQLALKIRPQLWNAQALLGLSELHLGATGDAQHRLEEAFSHLADASLRIQVGTALVQLDYEMGKLDEALSTTNSLMKMAPTNLDVLFMMYRLHSTIAANALATLAKVGPDSARLHEVLAESHASDNDFSGAILEYQRALELDPKLPGLHFELGEAILRNGVDEGSQQKAEQEFVLALAENPNDPHSEFELGQIGFMRSDLQGALQHYSRAVQLQPDLVDAQVALGKVLNEMHQPQEAVKHLLLAVHLDPENSSAHYQLSQSYRSLGERDDASREMKTFIELRKPNDLSNFVSH